MSRLAAIAALTGTYLLALGSADPLDALTGVLISIGLLVALRPFYAADEGAGGPPLLRRLLSFPRFALAVVREITVGTWVVTLIVLGLRPLREPGIVRVPIGERTPSGVAATTLAITLSPGELLVDIDRDEDVMLIHVLDASDPEAIRRRYEDFYRRYQQAVFP